MKQNENKNNEKPISINILIENLRNQIMELIVTSGLPASVLELIIKDVYVQTKEASMQVYKQEKNEYEKTLKESSTEK